MPSHPPLSACLLHPTCTWAPHRPPEERSMFGYLIDMARVVYRRCELGEAALGMILGGATLVATNPDPNCPTHTGIRPGCGAIVALLEAASGVKAFSVGKPSPVMLRAARKELGLTTDQTIVIGDTMETDILGGVQLGFKTILVLSGGTSRDDLDRYAYQPDKIVDSVADLDPVQLAREFRVATI